jgi:broad specificity phosphatase PhoE
MAALYLIRHGQASFGQADYDKLSTLGIKQAQILGKHWQQLSRPDKCYAGDLLRHGQTAEHFFQSYDQGDLLLNTHNGFNEFDHLDVLARYNSKWQDLAQLNSFIAQQSAEKTEVNKRFQQEFNQALQRWLSGEYDHQYKESWTQFKQRCLTALTDVIAQNSTKNSEGNSKNILVFTSAGPIAVLAQHILALADQQIFALNQQFTNSGVTKLLFDKQRLTIDYLNNYSHLELIDKKLITYR